MGLPYRDVSAAGVPRIAPVLSRERGIVGSVTPARGMNATTEYLGGQRTGTTRTSSRSDHGMAATSGMSTPARLIRSSAGEAGPDRARSTSPIHKTTVNTATPKATTQPVTKPAKAPTAMPTRKAESPSREGSWRWRERRTTKSSARPVGAVTVGV